MPISYAASVKKTDALAMDSKNRPLTFREAIRGPDKLQWDAAASTELFRLFDVNKTMSWIDWRSKPSARVSSYYNPQVKGKLNAAGARVFRVRGVISSNISDYIGGADIQTFNLLCNAASSKRAHLAMGDIHDFYMMSVLDRPEYMWLKRNQVPPDVLARCGSAFVWHEDNKGIYGLPHAGRLAQEKLVALLARHSYH